MKLKTQDEADCNITSMIDCLMQCIIFFMVIMSAQYVFGVAIKFPPPGSSNAAKKSDEKPKNIVVYVQSDYIEQNHRLVRDGILKLNGEEILLAVSLDTAKWEAERTRGYDELRYKMNELLKKGYKKDVLMIQGDMKTYHGKILKVIDMAKSIKDPEGESIINGFSLIQPEK